MEANAPSADDWLPPRPLASPRADVLLYWCVTRVAAAARPRLESWLSADERARMARFGDAALAHRYAAGRAGLRYVLATLLGSTPADVPIVRGVRGRPRLHAAGTPDFNVSNTHEVALIGVCTAQGARIGVDCEHRDRAVRHDGLARKFCTPAERAALAALDEAARRGRFLRLWTCKEAMSKATGDALGAPLARLDVALEPAPRLVGGPAPYTPADWQLLDAPVPADYVATVALWRPPALAAGGRTR